MVSEVQPYVGPRPFKREDAPFFFGRDREADELRSLIISHSEVLLYAQSGAGKTSLINTKLWTLLEDADLEVLPLARVQGPQPRSKIANIYVFNTLVKWSNNTATADELAGMTLREFLEGREQSLDKEGLPKPCVAIFDQFEELFTSHSECWQQRRGFFLQVRDALDALPQMRALFAIADQQEMNLRIFAESRGGAQDHFDIIGQPQRARISNDEFITQAQRFTKARASRRSVSAAAMRCSTPSS